MVPAADIRSAFRSLRRSGRLPWVVILMLGMAVGAVTAVFSIADAVLLRPLPLAEPDRVVLLWGRDDARSQAIVEVSLGDLRAWRAGQTSLDAIEVFGSVNWGELRVAAPGEPFRASMSAVSAGFFDVLGSEPLAGRTFRPEDDVPNAPRTVVLSGDLWQRQFGSDPSVVGTVLTVGEGRTAVPYEIIGVMPPDFRIPSGAEVWVAINPVLADAAREQGWNPDGVRAMYAVARLARGATIERAAAELSTIARREEIRNGLADSAMVVVATPLVQHLLGPARPALLAIGGAATALLLIGCANAAGLLLVHAASRRREVAVRLALGARRWDIVRQRLNESLLISVLAGILGVGVAWIGFDAIVGLVPGEVPRLDGAAIDARALAFALAVSVATALLVGLLPAWQHTGADLIPALHQRSGADTAAPAPARVRKVLVAAQIAAAVLLLTGAGLFTRSFAALLRLDLGFDPGHVLTFHLTAPESRYAGREQRWALVEAVIEQATQIPDVRAAGAIYLRPFAHGAIGMDSNVVIEGQPLTAGASGRNPILNWEAVTPGYFAAMDIRLVRGRLFDDRDGEHAPPVVIVSEALAARLWPGQDPVGRRILAYGAPGDAKQPGWQTVAGVVESARYREIETPRFDLYLPYRQAPNDVQHFVLRVSGDPVAIVPRLEAALTGIAPDVRVDGITTMDEIVGQVLAPWRFSAIVVSAFGIMALGFAAIGVAAVIAYAVTQRTREIGVRMAIGAQRRDVVLLFVRDGVLITAAGLVCGFLAAWVLRRSIASMLFGIAPGDGATFAATACLLGGVALAAAYIPARRAAAVDPASVLRAD